MYNSERNIEAPIDEPTGRSDYGRAQHAAAYAEENGWDGRPVPSSKKIVDAMLDRAERFDRLAFEALQANDLDRARDLYYLSSRNRWWVIAALRRLAVAS